MWPERNTVEHGFRILTIIPTGKRPLGRPRHRCKDNVKMDLKYTVVNAENRADSSKDKVYGELL